MAPELPSAKLAFSVPAAAKALDVSRSKLYDEMDCGRLRFIKLGRRRLITHDQLTQYLRALEQAA